MSKISQNMVYTNTQQWIGSNYANEPLLLKDLTKIKRALNLLYKRSICEPKKTIQINIWDMNHEGQLYTFHFQKEDESSCTKSVQTNSQLNDKHVNQLKY